jgi:hypothetical protein
MLIMFSRICDPDYEGAAESPSRRYRLSEHYSREDHREQPTE